MPATGYGLVVEAPPLQEAPSGLLAQFPPENAGADEHWLQGVTFSPESGVALELADICRASYSLSTDPTRDPARQFDPFAVILRERCSTFGWQEADFLGRASRALRVRRHFAVEREFEQGALNVDNPHLAATYTEAGGAPTDTITLAGGASVDPTDALGLLDAAIGSAAIGRGVIHATPFLVAQWTSKGLLEFEGSAEGTRRIVTPSGNVVVAGAGYQGRGPDGNIPTGAQWAYATDWIRTLASPVATTPGTLAQATAKEANWVLYRQDQFFVVEWSGLLHAAVRVNTSVEAAEGSGTVTSYADVTVDATAGGVQLLPANAARTLVTIQNTGAANMRVRAGADPTPTTGFQVAPGQTISFTPPEATLVIKAIREGGTNTTAAVSEVA